MNLPASMTYNRAVSSEGFSVDALTRLKQRKPWRGHIGQRALVPGRWMREIVGALLADGSARDILWLSLVLLLTMSTLLSLGYTQSAWGWVSGFAGVVVGLILVESMRGIAWVKVSGVLDGEQLRSVANLLETHPELMAACMHWMTPQTVLRRGDLELIKRAHAELDVSTEPSLAEIQELCLDHIKLELTQSVYPSYHELNTMARREAKRHVKPWKPGGLPARMLKKLSFKRNGKLELIRVRHLVAEWFLTAGSIHLVLIAASWMITAWMGSYTPPSEMIRPFGVAGSILWILLFCAVQPIASYLACKRLALTGQRLLNLEPWEWFRNKAAMTYLQSIPASHVWSDYDVAYAIFLGADSERQTIFQNCNIKVFLNVDKTEIEKPKPDETPLPPSLLGHRKPWQGHWGQRLLIPSKDMRELGSDLVEQPGFASGIVFLIVMFLEMVSGILVVQSNSLLSLWMFSAVMITLVQIDLLRMVAYINGSAPIMQIDHGLRAVELANKIEGAKAIWDRWEQHPSGIRILDYRALEKCVKLLAAPTAAKEKKSNQQQSHSRQKILKNIFHSVFHSTQSGYVLTDNPVAKARAKRVGKPLALWSFCDRIDPKSWELFSLGMCFYYNAPWIAKTLSLLAFICLYIAACGAWWMACAIGGTGTALGPWEVAFPLGLGGSLIVGGVGIVLLALLSFLINRSAAPESILDCFVEGSLDNMDVGACAAYLEELPTERDWTFEDLFVARNLINKAEISNEAERFRKHQADEVEALMQTPDARRGLSQAEGEQLEKITRAVETPETPPTRRRL